MAKRDKPKPISMKLVKPSEPKAAAKAPPLLPADPARSGPLNDPTPGIKKQIAKTNRAVENLFDEVKALRDAPLPEPVVPVVNVAPRPLIKKVSIKYDQLGFPSELIPTYEA